MHERYLPWCIESVLAQTFTDWELIICDDHSRDGSRQVGEAYARRDARIRFSVNDVNLGMYPNFRHVASLARGQYLKILCGDDWLHPECLEACVDLMERHPSCVIATPACVD